MAVVNSGVDVCSRALLLLGLKPIQSFEEPGSKASACKNLYATTVASLMAGYPWRFTLKKAQLARLQTTPLSQWKYAYQLPPDREGDPRKVFNAATVGIDPISTYEVQGSTLLTNEETVFVDYLNFPAESIWPPYFVQLAVYSMAAHLAPVLTDDQAKHRDWWTIAYGTPAEGGAGGYLRTAKALDAQSNPADAIPENNFVLVQVR